MHQKRINGTFGILSIMFLLFTLNACKCKKSDCINGQCSRGQCLCDFGWEGPNCDVAFRQKYIGTWNVMNLCNSGVSNYSLTVSESPSSNTHIYFDNLYNSGNQVEAEIVTALTFNIISQPFDSTTISGDGTYNEAENMVEINYNVVGFSPEEDCVAEMTK